jgi:murein L,D-transpeptidase YafK
MKKWLIVSLLAVAVVAAWANWPFKALPAGTVADRVVVKKSARVLELYRGADVIRSYPVSLGGTPRGSKQQAGDGRTPEGAYRLDYRKLDSSFHRALHISYPDQNDIASARSRGVDPGGLIMVHGMKNRFGWIGRAHRAIDWTDGCVAVTDREIDEIVRVVPDGTPIAIEP